MLKPKTVDGILETFRRTIAELEKVAEAATNESMSKMEQVERLEAEAQVARIEANRARSAAENIRQLIEAQA